MLFRSLDDGVVTLTLTTTSLSPCVNAVDTMLLHFSKQATVSAGADATICETETYTLINSTHTSGTSYAWTKTGDGSFNDASLLHPVYTPGANDKATGSVTLTLTVTSASPCISVTDAMVLHINRQTTCSAGISTTICETGTYTLSTSASTYAATTQWTSSGTGSFNDATLLHAIRSEEQHV